MKFLVTYESPPISEVAKQCTVIVFDCEELSFSEAAQAVNSINRVFRRRPLIEAANIISVEPSENV